MSGGTQARGRRSTIAKRALRGMGLRLILITIPLSILAYQHFVTAVREQALDSLAKYADERVLREQETFRKAEKNLAKLREAFLRKYSEYPDAQVEADFESKL